MSFVESWPSTEMRSNERLTQTPSSRSAVSGCRAASVCTKHSIVAKPGWIIPAPLACAVSRTVPDGSCDLEHARLANASVVQIAAAKSSAPSRRSSPCARARPRIIAWPSSCTPMTPVDATATWSSRTPPTIAAAPCTLRGLLEAEVRPVAAFALPELAATARIASSRVRSAAQLDRRGDDARAR